MGLEIFLTEKKDSIMESLYKKIQNGKGCYISDETQAPFVCGNSYFKNKEVSNKEVC